MHSIRTNVRVPTFPRIGLDPDFFPILNREISMLLRISVFLLLAASANAQSTVFSALSPLNPGEGFVPPISIGAIAGAPDMRIHILELGVGGDADAGSGPVLFSALGPGL